MTHIHHDILIHQPIYTVFNFVTNLENDHYWWKTIHISHKLNAEPTGVGTEFRQVARVMFIRVENHLRITAWEPPHHVRFINSSAQLGYTLDYRFVEEGNATRFSLDAQLEPKWMLRWLLPLTLRTLHNQLERYFTILKQHLETNGVKQQSM